MSANKKGVALRIRDNILTDVITRKGWAQEWDYNFAPETRAEIKRTWLRIINRAIGIKPRKERK